MAGEPLVNFDPIDRDIGHIAIKESVFPFVRFPGTDPVLSPEMKSTGEVMGIDSNFDIACQVAAWGVHLPEEGTCSSVKIRTRTYCSAKMVELVSTSSLPAPLHTRGTGLPVERVSKVAQGRPHRRPDRRR
jgi:carbamoyl-phosphate synthase large subunit